MTVVTDQPDFDDNDLGKLEDTVTRIIREVLFVEVPEPDTDLIDAGLLDSLGLVSLITELEVELGFELPLEELDVDGFRTVHGIAAFVTTALARQRSVG